MKFKEILTLAAVATSLVACSKEDSPIIDAVPTQQRDSLDWTLDFSTQWGNINLGELHPSDTKRLLGYHDEQVGTLYQYKSGPYDFTVMFFWYTFDGEDIRISGNLNGHPFIMSNCKFNMCNGPQGVSMTYTLKDYTGAVRSTCVVTNS